MSISNTARRRRFLGASGVIVILLVLGVGAVDIVLDRRNTIENAYQRLENLARIADEAVSGRLRAVDRMLLDVAEKAAKVRTKDDEAALIAFMEARAASLEEVRTISITNPQGSIVHTTLPEIRGFDGSQRSYFTAPLNAADRDRLFLHGPIQASTGAVVMFASRPLTVAEGVWNGVVVASLPPAPFVPIVKRLAPGEGGFAAMVGGDGLIMAHSPDHDAFLGKSVSKGPAFIAHLNSGKRMTRSSTVTVTFPQKMLVVVRTTEFPEVIIGMGWAEQQALAEWRVRSTVKGAVLALLAIIAALVLRRFARHESEVVSERNFARQVVETANVAVVGVDSEGAVTIFNAVAEATTGYDRDDVLGRNWFDLLVPDDAIEEFRSTFAAGKPLPRQFAARLRTKDGRERIVSWQNSAVSGNPSLAMISFGLDETERLHFEQELAASQRFLKAIADNMPGMVGYWDAELRCRFANKPYREWFGKEPDQILGHTIHELLGERLFAMNEVYIRAALRGERQTFERTLTKADGSTGYTWAHYIPDIDADGRVLGFFVLVADITPLKTTEFQLREASERLTLATRAGGIGVWSYDLGSGGLTWDARMYELYGIAPGSSEPVFEMWRSACHPSDLSRIEAELEAAIKGEAEFDTEFRILVPNGEIRHLKAAATVERSADGAPIRVIGINWDISVLREKERALVSAQEAAERANRAKSEFLANMSHEIRTPMNAILGLAHLLERTRLSTEQRDFAVKIKVAGRSLLSIINDILDFSKVEAGRLELEYAPFRLSDLLDGISTIMSVNASTKDLELVAGAAPETPGNLVGDALRLQQVLINLISNAIKFTERGEISLRIEQTGTTPDGKAELRFTVKDSGIGIAPETLPNLFDAFTQADSSTTRRYGGSGLGLAICKRLIELMGGVIGVDSKPEHGSTFWFTVPLAIAPKDEDRQVVQPMTGLSVLIADDNETARQVIADTAASLGWMAETAADGNEALERIQDRLAQKSPYDVLILDWKMPGMDGVSVGCAVREIIDHKDSPIVVMATAYSRDDLLRTPGADAIDATLVKPVTASSLYNAVMDAQAKRDGGIHALVSEIASSAEGERLYQVRLLLVEDNGINQDVARRVLELEGAIVAIADDGQQAVDRLAAEPDAFDAVLMDIQMPVMDGYEATTRIRHDLGLSKLPVIALTAGALSSERQRAHQAGMDDFIAKPFDVDQMVQCIRRHVDVAEPPRDSSGITPQKLLQPEIPGIDLRQASLRLGGDNGLYRSLLARLHDEFADTASNVRSHLANDKVDEAAHLLHTLRGASGNIGAIEVAALATQAEAAIKDEEPDDILQPLLQRLDHALGGLAQAIEGSGVLVGAPTNSSADAATAEDIADLINALKARKMSASNAFTSLRAGLAVEFGEELVTHLAAEIDGLKFDAAARRLASARETKAE